jgi:uncharacterized membrane protein
MDKTLALTIILVISLGGMAFSGYLTFGELVQKTCALGGGCSSVFGLPACVYGFVMYTIVFIISLMGLRNKNSPA